MTGSRNFLILRPRNKGRKQACSEKLGRPASIVHNQNSGGAPHRIILVVVPTEHATHKTPLG
jgi:hypothetical protein